MSSRWRLSASRWRGGEGVLPGYVHTLHETRVMQYRQVTLSHRRCIAQLAEWSTNHVHRPIWSSSQLACRIQYRELAVMIEQYRYTQTGCFYGIVFKNTKKKLFTWDIQQQNSSIQYVVYSMTEDDCGTTGTRYRETTQTAVLYQLKYKCCTAYYVYLYTRCMLRYCCSTFWPVAIPYDFDL